MESTKKSARHHARKAFGAMHRDSTHGKRIRAGSNSPMSTLLPRPPKRRQSSFLPPRRRRSPNGLDRDCERRRDCYWSHSRACRARPRKHETACRGRPPAQLGYAFRFPCHSNSGVSSSRDQVRDLRSANGETRCGTIFEHLARRFLFHFSSRFFRGSPGGNGFRTRTQSRRACSPGLSCIVSFIGNLRDDARIC